MASPDQKRVILWSAPRSLSTAIFRAVGSAEATQSIYEPYTNAYYYGSQRPSKRYVHLPVKNGLKYSDVRDSLEQDYADSDVVFIKDLAFSLMNCPEDPIDVLPRGYIHTFLIRNPCRTLSSLYNTSLKVKHEGWGYFDPMEACVKDLYELYVLITKRLNKKTIVIDADDLLNDPETMLRRYCDFTGIPFRPSMIAWKPGFENHPFTDNNLPDWFKTVMTTSRFLRPEEVAPLPDMDKMDETLRSTIIEHMPYYMKLYEERLV